MTPNQLPTDGVALLTAIDPSSSSAAQTSAWVPVQNFHSFLAVVDAGVFGALATVDFKIMQAKDNAGTASKALTNASTGAAKAITQLLAAGGNNRQALINARASDLDQTNGFGFIAIVLTVGTAASLVSAALLGFYPRFEPPVDSAANPAINLGAASVAQIVN